MLSIILLILKIIGITLLSILGLLLLMILLVLCVPIRYKGMAQKVEDIKANACVSWLLHLIHITVHYDENGMNYEVRIFGFKIIPKKEKKKKEKIQKKSDKKSENKTEVKSEDKNESKPETKIEDKSDDTSEYEGESVSGNSENIECDGTELENEVTENTVTENTVTENTVTGDTVTDNKLPDNAANDYKAAESVASDKTSSENIESKRNEKNDLSDLGKNKSNKKSKKQKRVKNKKDKPNIAEKLRNIYNKWEHIKAIIDDTKVRKSVKLIKRQVIKLFKHVLPRRINGNVKYGLEDPSYTGYITAVLGTIYGKIGKSFDFYPDFENVVFECDCKLKGHIRIGTLLLIVLRVVISKNCRYTYKLIKKEQEEA